MLEDRNIQHLISWSSGNESFVMSPSSEFSKVLAYVHVELWPQAIYLTAAADRTLSTPIFPLSSAN